DKRFLIRVSSGGQRQWGVRRRVCRPHPTPPRQCLPAHTPTPPFVPTPPVGTCRTRPATRGCSAGGRDGREWWCSAWCLGKGKGRAPRGRRPPFRLGGVVS